MVSARTARADVMGDVIGLPAKLVLVGLLSWLLYRRRPATLLLPAAVLLVILAYHASGLVIDS